MAYVTADQVIPGFKSKSEDWIAWYELIPGGRSVRNAIWLQAWKKWGSKDANTADLRAYMKKEAGVEITTNGLGSLVDTSYSAVDTLESIAMVPVYALAIGSAIVLIGGGFMVYQAFKNPEGVGKMVQTGLMLTPQGRLAKVGAASQLMAKGGILQGVGNRRTYWLAGAGTLLLIALSVWGYKAHGNQVIVDNIMGAINKNSDPVLGNGSSSYGDTRDLGNSKIFTTDYWRKAPEKVTIWAANANGTPGPAQLLAKQIWEAKSTSDLSRWQIRDYPDRVVSAFKALKTKEDVSKLADVFEGMYKTNLYNFINASFMTNGCDADQNDCIFGIATNYLKQIYDWITTQLT